MLSVSTLWSKWELGPQGSWGKRQIKPCNSKGATGAEHLRLPHRLPGAGGWGVRELCSGKLLQAFLFLSYSTKPLEYLLLWKKKIRKDLPVFFPISDTLQQFKYQPHSGRLKCVHAGCTRGCVPTVVSGTRTQSEVPQGHRAHPRHSTHHAPPTAWQASQHGVSKLFTHHCHRTTRTGRSWGTAPPTGFPGRCMDVKAFPPGVSWRDRDRDPLL